jgi:hypothetical protein
LTVRLPGQPADFFIILPLAAVLDVVAALDAVFFEVGAM